MKNLLRKTSLALLFILSVATKFSDDSGSCCGHECYEVAEKKYLNVQSTPRRGPHHSFFLNESL